MYLYNCITSEIPVDKTLLFYKDFKKFCGKKYQSLIQKTVTFLKILTENKIFRIPKQMTNLVTTMS